MLEACREMCYYPVTYGLPPGLTVEHLDHDRVHNCMCNLMLLDKRIHDAISIRHRYVMRGLNGNTEDAVASSVEEPDWVTHDAV
jgi:hypothetical protein